jgi:hypothetical protein
MKYQKDLLLSETGLFSNPQVSPRPSHHTRRARDDRAENANGPTLHRTGCDFQLCWQCDLPTSPFSTAATERT